MLMRIDTIVKYTLLLIGMVVLLWALYHAQVFLIPARVRRRVRNAMLMLPVSAKLEDWVLRGLGPHSRLPCCL